jgi:hypothetical protein
MGVTGRRLCKRRLTIVGGVREWLVVTRRESGKTVCARGAWVAPLGGPSTSPLGADVTLLAALRRLGRSFPGHLALWEAFWGVPMAVWALRMNYNEGTLTFAWALWCILVAGVLALVVGALFWFTFFKGFIARRNR